jgi:hypothetical protein
MTTVPRPRSEPAVTSTILPRTSGWRRNIPIAPRPEQVELIRELLHQTHDWVLRPDWNTYVRTQDRSLTIGLDRLTRDQLVAIHAWLRQQRHALYRLVEGHEVGAVAPDGWIEAMPLYQCVRKQAHLDY